MEVVPDLAPQQSKKAFHTGGHPFSGGAYGRGLKERLQPADLASAKYGNQLGAENEEPAVDSGSFLFFGVGYLSKDLFQGGAAPGQLTHWPTFFDRQCVQAFPGIALHVKCKARPVAQLLLNRILDPVKVRSLAMACGSSVRASMMTSPSDPRRERKFSGVSRTSIRPLLMMMTREQSSPLRKGCAWKAESCGDDADS